MFEFIHLHGNRLCIPPLNHQIEIEKFFWDDLSEFDKEGLIFHELGHLKLRQWDEYSYDSGQSLCPCIMGFGGAEFCHSHSHVYKWKFSCWDKMRYMFPALPAYKDRRSVPEGSLPRMKVTVINGGQN